MTEVCLGVFGMGAFYGLRGHARPAGAFIRGVGCGPSLRSAWGFWGWVMSQLSNLSAPFIFRPIATMLMSIGLALAGAVS